MTTKTRMLAGGLLRPATRIRVDHTAAPEETITILSRPTSAVRVVRAGPTFVEVENTTPKVAFIAVVAGPTDGIANAHRWGVLDLIARALNADVAIMGDKR